MPTIPTQDSPIITPATDLTSFSADPAALDEETALLLAVRDRLRKYLVLDVDSSDIHVELDEMAHQIKGYKGLIIASDGGQPGSDHMPGGTTVHEVLGVFVSVVVRTTHLPRDRKWRMIADVDRFLVFNATINQQIRRVRDLIDYDQDLRNLANDYLASNGRTGNPIVTPLVWVSQDKRPRAVGPELFSASKRSDQKSESSVGLVKTIYFGHANCYSVRENFKDISQI